MPMPDFLVIGAPKAGTTALHAALARHPRLYMSAVKEPKFFLSGGPPPTKGGPGDALTYREHIWRRPDYEALFDAAPPGTLRGESTPLYLYDRAALRRIRETLPGARLIVVVRDPVERAHSNWTHLWSAGLEPVGDFVRACGEEERRICSVGRDRKGLASEKRAVDGERDGDVPVLAARQAGIGHELFEELQRDQELQSASGGRNGDDVEPAITDEDRVALDPKASEMLRRHISSSCAILAPIAAGAGNR